MKGATGKKLVCGASFFFSSLKVVKLLDMAKGMYQKWLENDNLLLLQGWKRNGLTDEQIAKNIGVTARTLENWKSKHVQIFRALKTGKEQANFAVENKLFKRAIEGNTTAMIFWLKNNWRDKYNDSALSPEERKLAKARMQKLEADTRISEAKAAVLERMGSDSNKKLDEVLEKLVGEANELKATNDE